MPASRSGGSLISPLEQHTVFLTLAGSQAASTQWHGRHSRRPRVVSARILPRSNVLERRSGVDSPPGAGALSPRRGSSGPGHLDGCLLRRRVPSRCARQTSAGPSSIQARRARPALFIANLGTPRRSSRFRRNLSGAASHTAREITCSRTNTTVPLPRLARGRQRHSGRQE